MYIKILLLLLLYRLREFSRCCQIVYAQLFGLVTSRERSRSVVWFVYVVWWMRAPLRVFSGPSSAGACVLLFIVTVFRRACCRSFFSCYRCRRRCRRRSYRHVKNIYDFHYFFLFRRYFLLVYSVYFSRAKIYRVHPRVA